MSAAANHAVDSGLSNTLPQEEQYHRCEQLQLQQQQLYCQFGVDHNTSNNNPLFLDARFGSNNDNHYVNKVNLDGFYVQPLLKQNKLSMSSSVSPIVSLPANKITQNNTHNCRPIIKSSFSNMANNSSNEVNIHDEEEYHLYHQHQLQQNHYINDQQLAKINGGKTSVCERSEFSLLSSSNSDGMRKMINSVETVEDSMIVSTLVTEDEIGNAAIHTLDVDMVEWNMSDEGRYGIPGAAGLDYQKYELKPQSQTPANIMTSRPLESTLMNNDRRNVNKNVMNNNNNSISENNSTQNSNINTLKAKDDELRGFSSDELYRMLNEYNVLQDKYHTVLLLPRESKREVTAGGRDGSAYVLRCLKMWYELPSDVLFSAMGLVDRFLDRMAVKPKHMACMSVASFHLAIKQLELKPIPPEELVTISQCGCTAGDLERMASVIASKLGVQMGTKPVTAVTILRVFYSLFRNLAKEVCAEFYDFFLRMIKLEDLENRLENLLCDVKTTVVAPSTLALILICLHLDFHIKASYKRERPELKPVFEYILFLQHYLRIPDRVFSSGFTIVADILSHYNGQNKQPYKQRLVWKLSSRTMKVLRPTNRFSTDLPTIDEDQVNVVDDGCRSRTESISSEEEEDWPTSPIIPIFEQC